MKISRLLIAASVLMNVMLLLVLIAGTVSDSTPPSTNSGSSHTGATAANGEAGARTDALGNELSLTPEIWTGLHTTDLALQRDRLRTAGFPPDMVRAILAGLIRQTYTPRRKELEAILGDSPWYRPKALNAAQTAEFRTLVAEENRRLEELLGPSPTTETALSLRRQFPSFSAEKVDQLAAIRDRNTEMQRETLALRGQLSTEDRERLTALEKNLREEISRVLSPQELEEYDLRLSNTANQLRSQLASFNASEAEFRALYKLQNALAERMQNLQASGPVSQETMRSRIEAQKEHNDGIKAALGDARYAEYQRATDYSYRQTNLLVARLELPPETTDQVYAVQKSTQERLTALQSDRTLALDARNAQLATMAADAEAKLIASLGPRGLEAYKQNGGNWLQALQPRPSPPLPQRN